MLLLVYQYRLGEQISLVLLELSSVINIIKLSGATRSGLIYRMWYEASNVASRLILHITSSTISITPTIHFDFPIILASASSDTLSGILVPSSLQRTTPATHPTTRCPCLFRRQHLQLSQPLMHDWGLGYVWYGAAR